jgi:1,4-alpha-glucan branching enzyme
MKEVASEPAATAMAGPRNVPGGILFTLNAADVQSVHLAGSFNNWSTSADALVRDAGGTWKIVKPLAAGSHQYKFILNGQQWKEDPANSTSSDDGYGGKNSLVQVGADGRVVAEAADAVPTAATPIGGGPKPALTAGGPKKADKGWVFAITMPEAQSVHLAGTFNSWSTSADPLAKGASGLWQITKELPAGSHQYKFVINGGQQWKEDPGNPNSADDGYGGKNSLLVVP